jgi:hypothetical protein
MLLDAREGGPESLSVLLAAAAAPATAHELAAEQAALTAFRTAHFSPVPHPRRPSMLKATLAQLIATKFLATAAVAAAATGGVALAAATGSLPSPLQGAAHAGFGAPSPESHPSHSDATDEPSDSTPSPDATATPEAGDSTASATPLATPTPSLNGLCKAYQAGAASNPGKVLSNPAFSVLVATAGGADAVGAYCTTLVGPARTHPTGAPTTHPTGAPTSHPTGAPTSHPTGAPTSHPTGAPATHPTGAPASVPGRP